MPDRNPTITITFISLEAFNIHTGTMVTPSLREILYQLYGLLKAQCLFFIISFLHFCLIGTFEKVFSMFAPPVLEFLNNLRGLGTA